MLGVAAMSWLKVGLLASIIFGLYYLQQIKITLKSKGYDVDMLTGWIQDYRRFKQLTLKEPDKRQRIQFQGILNGLHLALLGLAFFAAYFLFNR
jgi:hypothetical protein